MTATYPAIPSMPPIVCTLWCEDQDGHPDSVLREDQTCWGPDAYVDLSLEPVGRDEYGVYPPKLGARAYRQWPGKTPCVYIHIEDVVIGNEPIDTALHLTAAEARQLSANLAAAADAIEPSG